ncbi:MAG TPA: phage protein Gp36 family protein [Thermoanaerobaculia bacterium]|jgi:phage gp36-like protein|nr:phage protein Gp36 family protein [Thermoanaerobaculia bacterium]
MPPLFATRADLESTYSPSRVAALVSVKGGDADEAITAALIAASELAVGYLKSRYPTIDMLSAPECPATLRVNVAKLAMHQLGLGSDHLSDDVGLERDSAVRFLRDAGKGAVDLGLPGAPPEDRSAIGTILTDASGEVSELSAVVAGWLG